MLSPLEIIMAHQQNLTSSKKIIGKDINYGYSLLIPLASITSIPGLKMVPNSKMAQNTIDEVG